MKIHHNVVVNNKEGIRTNSAFINGVVVNNTVINNEKLHGCYTYPADAPSMKGSVFANNLYTGTWAFVTGANAPTAKNNVEAGTLASDYTLPDGHAAIDAGVKMAPYTDGFKGSAPDVGAIEKGTKMFAYGANL